MEALTNWIESSLGLSPSTQYKILTSALILIGAWVIRKVMLHLAFKRNRDLKSRYNWQKTSGYITVIIVLALVGGIWLESLKALMTFLGILSAGLVLALKDPIMNLAAWIFIVWRKPFEVGDRIQVGEYAGDVIDVRIFQFSLIEIGRWVDADQSTGRIIHIPNGRVFTDMVANFSAGLEYIWNEIPVLVTFESDWKKAKKILQDVVTEQAEHFSASAREQLNRLKGRFLIYYEKLSPTVYTSVKESGVMLTIRYMCNPRSRRDSSEKIWEDILKRFNAEEDIDFAYPTKRIHMEPRSGRKGASSRAKS